MDSTKMSVAAIGIAIVLFAACAAASSQICSTPLYTLRMEQVSSKMNFLPTAVNGFTYTTVSKCTVNYNTTKYRVGAVPLNTKPGDTYCESCIPETCEETCDWTCFETCPYTCEDTCEDTCPETCVDTCETCEGPTCDYTCTPFNCPWTEWPGCEYTEIIPTCNWPTCYGC